MSAIAEPLTAATAPSTSSVPASTPASTGAEGAATADQGALLTDEQILGLDTPAEGAPSDTASAAGTVPAAQDKPAAPASAEPAQLTIDDFRPLFQGNPKVQSLWDKYQNQTDLLGKFGTLSDAAKVAATIEMLGSPDALETLASKAADVDQTDSTFFGGMPEERQALVNNWYDGEGPHEFGVTSKAVRDMVDVTMEVMKQRDSEGFYSFQDKLTRQALTAEKFPEYLVNLAQALESGNGVEEAAKLLLNRFGTQLGFLNQTDRKSPEAQRLMQEKEQFGKDKQAWQSQKNSEAANSAFASTTSQISGSIEKALGDLKLNGRPVFGEKSGQIRAVITVQIAKHLDEALAKNAVYLAQINSLKAQGKYADMPAVTMRYVNIHLPQSVKAIVDGWTKGVVAGAQGAAQRAASASSRPDIAGGTASAGSLKGQPMSVAEMKKQNAARLAKGEKPISDEEILGLPVR